MDSWAYIPKRLLGVLAGIALIPAIAVGIFTGDPHKGAEFFMKEIKWVTQPIVNRLEKRIEKALERTTATTTSTQ